MKKGLIGAQMMMFGGKVREMGTYAVLRKLAEIGYHCIEISQIPMTPENVDGMKRACDAFDIKVAACSAGLEPMGPGLRRGDALATDFDKIVADCKALDTTLLRIGMLPFGYMATGRKRWPLSHAPRKWLPGWPSTISSSTITTTTSNSKSMMAGTCWISSRTVPGASVLSWMSIGFSAQAKTR